jgi:hypothetical protein
VYCKRCGSGYDGTPEDAVRGSEWHEGRYVLAMSPFLPHECDPESVEAMSAVVPRKWWQKLVDPFYPLSFKTRVILAWRHGVRREP